jgi:DNA-binding CsgD family transcriptional regulator
MQKLSGDARFRAAASRQGLVGRDAELARLEQEFANVRSGRGGALIVRGTPGIGKKMLVESAARDVQDMRVIRARCVETEKQFPYAVLQLLCSALADELQRLASPQRDALSAVIDAGGGPLPEPFVIGRAAFSLLTHAAQLRPLVLIIDDAQWIDRWSAQVLSFVSRRLDIHPIMILPVARDTPHVAELQELPELRLAGLPPAALNVLLRRVFPGPLDPSMAEQIITESAGNPLAVLDLLRVMSAADLAGGFGVMSAREQRDELDHGLIDLVTQLPQDSQQLLLTAAAEPTGDPSLLWRSAAHLGIEPHAGQVLESAGLLELAGHVAFRRPLVRWTVYAAATSHERRVVHRALAACAGPFSDPLRHLWHRLHAAAGPDDELAGELERNAPVVRERGGLPAAAAFLEQASLLTTEPRLRATRALAAATAKRQASDNVAAQRLLRNAELGPFGEGERLTVERQRAHLADVTRRGDAVVTRLVRVARECELQAAESCAEVYLEALEAAIHAGSLGLDTTAGDVAKAADGRQRSRQPDGAVTLLLDGLARRFTHGPVPARQPLAQALEAFVACDPAVPADEHWRWGALASMAAADIWDAVAWRTQTAAHVEIARITGALAVLPDALNERAIFELHAGKLAAASELVDEATAVSVAVQGTECTRASLLLAAWRGAAGEARDRIERVRHTALEGSEGLTLTSAALAASVLHNSLGRHQEALAAARDADEFDDLALHGWVLVELIEAAVGAGESEVAELAFERLCERTRPSGTDWALGMEARSQALLREGPIAEDLFRESIHRLGRCRMRSHRARAELLYGEWLRRHGRRRDAREQLRSAHQSFEGMGAACFAERAQRELLATGEKLRRRPAKGGAQLTPQEARIASLASDGLSNPAIGARIFVSPRTVEYHLHKVFSKLGISSRNELHLVLREIRR